MEKTGMLRRTREAELALEADAATPSLSIETEPPTTEEINRRVRTLGRHLLQVFVVPPNPPEPEIENFVLGSLIRVSGEVLGLREEGILMYRLGVVDGMPRKRSELSRIFGIGRDRVGQIEKAAIDKVGRTIRLA